MSTVFLEPVEEGISPGASRVSPCTGSKHVVKEGDVVTVYDESHPRGLWRLGKVERLVHGSDGVVRGVYVKVMSKKGHPKTLCRPLQHIYPGFTPTEASTTDTPSGEPNCSPSRTTGNSTSNSGSMPRRPVRRATAQAHDRLLGCAIRD